jgi:NADH-quinone oxidoreductase subunit C
MYPDLKALEALRQQMATTLSGRHISSSIVRGELTMVSPAFDIVPVLTILRDHPDFLFTLLIDVCGVDWPAREARFDVVYHLLSLKHNCRIRIKVEVAENTPVPSVVGVFPCANWHERETFDMFGIVFEEHQDLRRILTDYGFEGHPLRKDFPLVGFTEVRYDEKQKKVVYEPVSLTQDYRNFDYLSPWEGMTNVQLPGDNKGANPLASKVGGRG